MKLCQTHHSQLRTRASAWGLRDHFQAESLLLAHALAQAPDLISTGPGTCHVCALIKPSWIDKVCQQLAHAERSDSQ